MEKIITKCVPLNNCDLLVQDVINRIIPLFISVSTCIDKENIKELLDFTQFESKETYKTIVMYLFCILSLRICYPRLTVLRTFVLNEREMIATEEFCRFYKIETRKRKYDPSCEACRSRLLVFDSSNCVYCDSKKCVENRYIFSTLK
jgi:hypothetical protein